MPGSWAEARLCMPPEAREEDCGWMAGPIDRPLLPFKGRTPGPTDATITAASTPEDIMLTQITTEWKHKVLKYAYTHVKE